MYILYNQNYIQNNGCVQRVIENFQNYAFPNNLIPIKVRSHHSKSELRHMH